jgi:hypothetical protein
MFLSIALGAIFGVAGYFAPDYLGDILNRYASAPIAQVGNVIDSETMS